MVVRQDVPLWDERFVGYGYDKVSHTTRLHAAGYRFAVLPDVFIIHAEHGIPQWRGKGDLVRVRVWFNYYSFLGEITMQYATEQVPHSHLYEGIEWGQEEGVANPLIVPAVVLCVVALAWVFLRRWARAWRRKALVGKKA